ncbi:ATP-dependent nuclease [Glutamicibacter sp. BSL13]
MRLSHFKIQNYRGLRLAQADQLDEQQLVLITGKNGTGKSLVLEALTAAWTGNINLPEFVGPYGSSLVIEIGVIFTDEEYEQVNKWRQERDMEPVEQKCIHVLEAVSANSEETGRYSKRDDMLTTVQNELFSKDHPFSSLDLLSARRQVSLTTSSSVDLDLLDKTASARSRRDMYEQEIRWKSAMQMPDIGTYLMSLDYRDFLATRGSVETEPEYRKLQEIFFRATRKEILVPEYDPQTTKSSINVVLPSTQKHSLEDLSNGEREMLGMLYYISQLSAQGGVLLLDEPEKHLHPTLQLAVLRAMASVSERSQILVVTHSPGIIAATPAQSVVTVRAAWEAEKNQIERLESVDEQVELLADLGITQKELYQSSFLLVLEGPHDEKRLQMLLPDEMAAATVIVAGGRDAALKTADALQNLEFRTPWLCVVDRDFLSDCEVDSLTKDKNIFVWDARMLECVLLTPDILNNVFALSGYTKQQIKEKFDAALEEIRPVALEQFVSARIRRHSSGESNRVSTTGADKTLVALTQERDKLEYIVQNYESLRASIIQEVDKDWPNSWNYIVDGKAVFAKLQTEIGLYRNMGRLTEAVMVAIQKDGDLMPPEISRLKSEIHARMESRSPVSFDEGESEQRDSWVAKVVRENEPDPRLNLEEPHYGYGC